MADAEVIHMTTPLEKPGSDKYITFKRRDWNNFVKSLVKAGVQADIPDEVLDAVVLRGQDIFTPQVFWTYSHAVMAFIEWVMAFTSDENGELTDDAVKLVNDLQSRADLFSEIATWAAELETRKIPD